MKKSRKYYGSIGTDVKFPIDVNIQFIKYKYRWRPIAKDELGNTYVDMPAVTQFFEIKQYTPEETREMIDLYGE